jgi:hypothetical protein
MSNDYNAADRRHVRLAQKEAKREDTERKEIIMGLMSLPAGRAWMLARLESCHIFAPSFARNALDMAFAEGERNVGLQLLNDIMSACPDRYTEMMHERNAKDAARRTSRTAPRDDPAPDASDDSAREAGGGGEGSDTERAAEGNGGAS